MTRNGRKVKMRSRKWWTEERLLDALQRFYKDFGYCPTSSEDYAKHAQHTGRTPYGRPSNLGWHQKYPSFATILNHWPTFRQAWKAAGFDVGNENEEWSTMEDWFILESLGVMHREEVAELPWQDSSGRKATDLRPGRGPFLQPMGYYVDRCRSTSQRN